MALGFDDFTSVNLSYDYLQVMAVGREAESIVGELRSWGGRHVRCLHEGDNEYFFDGRALISLHREFSRRFYNPPPSAILGLLGNFFPNGCEDNDAGCLVIRAGGSVAQGVLDTYLKLCGMDVDSSATSKLKISGYNLKIIRNCHMLVAMKALCFPNV